MRPTYSVTYSIVTDESAADGDFAECGIEVDDTPLTPDRWDVEDAEDAGLDPVVYLALRELDNHAAWMPSASHATGNEWYTTADAEPDYATGERKELSVHFSGLTEAQEAAIFAEAKHRNR